MSTTTTTSDGEDHETTNIEKKPRYKRRKIAIFFAYCGVGYQGMQKNPGAKTIEGDLEEALFFSGAVPEQDRGHPKRFDWARSARTDKGVSAVGQVVSGRFYIDPPGFIERLNNNLPSQFKIFGFKRVTNSFNAKKFCDRRRYVYLVPVFALDPACHRDRESVLASLGSGAELVKCLECSERGRKVEGIMGKKGFFSKLEGEVHNGDEGLLQLKAKEETQDRKCTELNGSLSNNAVTLSIQSADTDNASKNGVALLTQSAETNIASDNGAALSLFEVKEEAMVCSINGDDNRSIPNETNIFHPGLVVGEQKFEESVLNSELVNEQQKIEAELEGCVKGSGFCYGEKEKARFNRILKHYEGTHNFHNFTTRIKAEDPSATRYIISFKADTVVTVDGIDFVKCEVVGQSFMLHQIRKMIGVAVAIMRNCAPESLIETALHQNLRITMPTAPEVGLYLDECFFMSYNQKWNGSHEEVSMKDYEKEAEDFKMKHIYSHIASTEHKEGAVALWLHSLNYRNYPDLQFPSNGGNTDVRSDEVEVVAE